ncbi:MAG: ATP-grasp domain [Idiomarinaceae bacterium HL-53]|nr:MAG: ATP-grasp domain [Idiomarinaceae bacterium HL-53]CUS47671.1 ATP-grasp domain-containing protein [Idiomarinaceae bacterium HL-53]
MLLIITNSDDVSVDYLIRHLDERNLPFFRFNSDFASDYQINVSIAGNEFGGTIRNNSHEVDFLSVTSVLYRRAIRPVFNGPYRNFRAREFRHAFEGLLLALGERVRWVNPLHETELAERKVLQLRAAQKEGFNVLPSVISNNFQAVESFLSRLGEEAVAKPVSHGLVLENQRAHSVYATLVDSHKGLEREAVELSPVIYQKAVVDKKDVRLTVIGSSIFTVSIEQEAEAQLDWRKESCHCKYLSIQAPVGIEKKCLRLMKRLGLNYGAFDFVIDTKGVWYFLEVNPAGEWAWLDVALGLSMRDAFEQVLYEH